MDVKERNILIVLTILLLLSGLIIGGMAYFENIKNAKPCSFDGKEFSEGDVVDKFQENSRCTCSAMGFIECIPLSADDENKENDNTEELMTEGLTFSSKYLVGFPNNADFVNVPLLDFKDISYQDTGLKVVLEQLQTCPELNVVPQQYGFYGYENNVVTLMSMVRKTEDPNAIKCLVELTYEMKDIVSDDVANLKIQFKDEQDALITAPFCSYYGKIYSDEDVFKSKDSEEICICESGLVSCE